MQAAQRRVVIHNVYIHSRSCPVHVLSLIARPAGAMSAASAYEEKWPGTEIDLESIVEAEAGEESDEAAVRELKKLLTTILPARMAGSEAASRDLVKVCTIMNNIVDRMGAVEALPERVSPAPLEEAAENTDKQAVALAQTKRKRTRKTRGSAAGACPSRPLAPQLSDELLKELK